MGLSALLLVQLTDQTRWTGRWERRNLKDVQPFTGEGLLLAARTMQQPAWSARQDLSAHSWNERELKIAKVAGITECLLGKTRNYCCSKRANVKRQAQTRGSGGGGGLKHDWASVSALWKDRTLSWYFWAQRLGPKTLHPCPCLPSVFLITSAWKVWNMKSFSFFRSQPATSWLFQRLWIR